MSSEAVVLEGEANARHVERLERDPLYSLWFRGHTQWVWPPPPEQLASIMPATRERELARHPDGSGRIRLIDSVLLSMYKFCIEHYGEIFLRFKMIHQVFWDLLCLPASLVEERSPQVFDVKLFVFFCLLDTEKGIRMEFFTHYRDDSDVRAFTAFLPLLHERTEHTLNEPYQYVRPNIHNVNTIITSFLKDALSFYLTQ